MTDLTYCYLHMSENDLQVLDTIGTSDYITGELSDTEVDVPPHMVPPNPDDSDVLPSQVHPSYPYGNPTNPKHPAARPRRPYDPSSRALFEDMGYAGGGVNGSLRWKDLALDQLLPLDEEREETERAAQARKLASGITANHSSMPLPAEAINRTTEEGDEENDENDDDDDDDDDDNEEGDREGSQTESEEE